MHLITNDDLTGLMGERPPCVSVYLPTPRTYPGRQQGPINLSNLVDRVEEALQRKYSSADRRPLVARLRALAEDSPFWLHREADGLAALASPEGFDTFDLRYPT